MRVAVTGANGFVGIEVTRQLLEQGHEVLAIDSLRYSPWRIEAPDDSALRKLELDIRDGPATAAAIADFAPDAIIHLAAIHYIPECERLPAEAISINVEGTVNLLVSLPSTCRFVLASTAAVYAPSARPHLESDPLGPMDLYGHTKLFAEQLVSYYSDQNGFKAVNVRLFNVVGPGETNPHVLPEIITQLREGSRRLHLGNTSPRRDYIYVGDAASGFLDAATKPLPDHEGTLTVNLGAGRAYSVTDLVERMNEIVGGAIHVEVDRSRVRIVDRPALCADIGAIRKLFGWEPSCNLETALRTTWEDPRMVERNDREGLA
jgi:UDP-glucose 4-epimerase